MQLLNLRLLALTLLVSSQIFIGQRPAMAKEHPEFLDKLASTLKQKYQEQYAANSSFYSKPGTFDNSDNILKSEFEFKLLPDGTHSAALLQKDYSKPASKFDSLCRRAISSTQMPKVIDKDHEAHLRVVFTASKVDLPNVSVQAMLAEKGIVEVKKTEPFGMPDFSALEANSKQNLK